MLCVIHGIRVVHCLLVSVECLHPIRLLVRRCICPISICPRQTRHIEDSQALYKGINRGVEGAFSDFGQISGCDGSIGVEAPDADHLASTDCVAAVAVSRMKGWVIDLQPMKSGESEDEYLVVGYLC